MDLVKEIKMTRIKLYFTGTSAVKLAGKAYKLFPERSGQQFGH